MYTRRLIYIVLIIILSAFAIGKYFDYRYKKRWHWLYFSKIDEATKGTTNYDIILLGNSRIHTGLNPYVIDSVTGLKSYNLAIGSGDEQEMKLLGSVYLKNHKPPKYVFIGVDYFLLMKYEILKERFAYLFYLDNDTIYNFMKRNGFPCKIIKTVPFFKYSFFDEYNRTSIFIGNGKIKRVFNHNYYKGFINIFPDLNSDSITESTKNSNESYFNMPPPRDSINNSSAKVFLETIEMFQKKGSKVILMYPPAKKKPLESAFPELDSFYTYWAACYTIPLIKTYPIAITPKYFVDDNHLNEPGSRLLSISIANFIEQGEKEIYKR